jgi:hypothetical protein
MAKRTEEQHERREQPWQKLPRPSAGKKRKPRGPLFHSGDPTLAKRLEEIYRSER